MSRFDGGGHWSQKHHTSLENPLTYTRHMSAWTENQNFAAWRFNHGLANRITGLWSSVNEVSNSDCADVILKATASLEGLWDPEKINPKEITQWLKDFTDTDVSLGSICRCKCPMCGYWVWILQEKTLERLPTYFTADAQRTRLFWNGRVLCSITVVDK
jgi:hypothetical protein